MAGFGLEGSNQLTSSIDDLQRRMDVEAGVVAEVDDAAGSVYRRHELRSVPRLISANSRNHVAKPSFRDVIGQIG